MWSLRGLRLTIAGQFLILQLAVIALVLTIVGVISVQQSTTQFGADQGSRMRSVAEYLANLPVVRDQITAPRASQELAPSVERAVSLSGATNVTIADPDGRVIASSIPDLVGEQVALGGSRVREGRGWTGDVDENGERVVAGHAPIIANDGSLVGLSIAEARYPSAWQRITNAAPDLVLFLGIGALLGVAGSWLLARMIKRRTRGLEPAEIAALADNREALLHSIREGIIAVNSDGIITVVNESATTLLSLPDDSEGRSVGSLAVGDQVKRVLLDPSDTQDSMLLVGERLIVLNRNRVTYGNRQVGTVTTLRDRTELIAMQSQVDSHQSITETLRAQTHEFANQLHTISGLVELEEYDEVSALIGNLTRRQAEIADAITAVVEDPTVAALLIAKTSLAAEGGVRIKLTADSRLLRADRELSTDVATVLGNLIDNAIDASSGAEQRVVRIRVTNETDAVVLEVSDSGAGVSADVTDAIFQRGFSTKPSVLGGRGVGLALVHLVCTRRGGTVTVHNDGGAVFRATLPNAKAMHDLRAHR